MNDYDTKIMSNISFSLRQNCTKALQILNDILWKYFYQSARLRAHIYTLTKNIVDKVDELKFGVIEKKAACDCLHTATCVCIFMMYKAHIVQDYICY